MDGSACIYLFVLFLMNPSNMYENVRNAQKIDNYTIGRHKRQSSCKTGEISCTSGQCVPEENECDGKSDCEDQSDEANCTNFRCTPNLFQCAYGACIMKTAVCDGNRDCRDNSDETTPPCTVTKSSICRRGQFQCNSNDCINEEKLCDGKPDCPDNSDETTQECSQIYCNLRIFFQCDYGACLSNDVKCNGVKDCFDGSDEKNCTTTKPQSGNGCLIPNHPRNGQYKIGANKAIPGQYTPMFSILVAHCKHPFKPNPPVARRELPICLNDTWTITPHSCARSCEPLSSTETTKVSCKHFGEILDNCDNPVEGTVAKVECMPFYEFPEFFKNPDTVCRGGHWDFVQCLPVCGEKRPKGVTDIVGGRIALKSDYPWHVAIYNATNDNICGGTIISHRIVLSAAHCFTDSYGKLYPINDYKIIAGKYYRAYDDPRDEGAQESPIDPIVLPERYKATENNYEADLAILVLTKKLKSSVDVQPICVDWRTSFEKQQLFENNVGVVVGWGQTVLGSHPSTELKELQVPYKPYRSCFAQVPVEFRKFLTHDKICAGYLSKEQAVCQGDSGGGLAFQKNENRFYLRGIVSTSPATKETGTLTCDPNQYATYTLISSYIQLISDVEIQNRS
ncbi:hypothetical protein RI129_000644 [Pyrocoelia pectoralis]|uniref:Peptidase S1 domain-containing protein n=1 Tax=Pyrocoelia pectoralis TaxID=417401 RepID=A0AAN7VII5_9COLE